MTWSAQNSSWFFIRLWGFVLQKRLQLSSDFRCVSAFKSASFFTDWPPLNISSLSSSTSKPAPWISPQIFPALLSTSGSAPATLCCFHIPSPKPPSTHYSRAPISNPSWADSHTPPIVLPVSYFTRLQFWVRFLARLFWCTLSISLSCCSQPVTTGSTLNTLGLSSWGSVPSSHCAYLLITESLLIFIKDCSWVFIIII